MSKQFIGTITITLFVAADTITEIEQTLTAFEHFAKTNCELKDSPIAAVRLHQQVAEVELTQPETTPDADSVLDAKVIG